MSTDALPYAVASARPRSPDDGLGFLFRVIDAKQAGEYLQVPSEVVIAEAESGRLPGQKIGTEWRFVPLAIAEWLLASRPSPTSANRDALLAVAGSLADDETLNPLVVEIYRQRKQDRVGARS